MKYKQLRTMDVRGLSVDGNGNVIIKIEPEVQRIVLQVKKDVPMTDNQFNQLISEIRMNRTAIQENKVAIQENKGSIDKLTKVVKKNHPDDF